MPWNEIPLDTFSRSYGVHALIGQGCFSGTSRIQYLEGVFNVMAIQYISIYNLSHTQNIYYVPFYVSWERRKRLCGDCEGFFLGGGWVLR